MWSKVNTMRKTKHEYHQQTNRVTKLPQDYRFVYQKISEYMWSFAGGDGSDMVAIMGDILDLFESGVIDGKHVLELTGSDVAAFCDAWLLDAKQWTDGYGKRLNRRVKETHK
ncbi:MAG: DUF1048 domain-containing protein [Erysipelotrichaceae bacterium]